MDDITLSYTDDYYLRTYTATLQCSVSYSIDRERLATAAVDEEYLICAALIDKIGDKVYDYTALNDVLLDLRCLSNFLQPHTENANLLGLAIERLTQVLSMSSRLTNKQQIHQLLQGGTNGPATYYDQRHAIQSLTRTTPRHDFEVGDSVPRVSRTPGTSTARTDLIVDTHNNS